MADDRFSVEDIEKGIEHAIEVGDWDSLPGLRARLAETRDPATRYVATFDSEHPERGIVVDEQGGRYAGFLSPARAERAAAKMNRSALDLGLPDLAQLLIWRSTDTGQVIV